MNRLACLLAIMLTTSLASAQSPTKATPPPAVSAKPAAKTKSTCAQQAELDKRSAALDKREAELAKREAALDKQLKDELARQKKMSDGLKTQLK
jgi:hypothetical protein